MTPLISVVLAARNARGTLPRALASLAAQTMPDWECVVVDDGSTDGTADAVVGDSRFRVVRQAGAGLTAALRRGVSEARGTLIARLDADDVCLPDRLRRQSEELARRPEVVAIGCGVELVSESGSALGSHVYPSDHAALVASLDSLLTPIPHSTLMVRRDALESAGGYRAAFIKAQDYDLLRRLSELGRLSSLSDVLVRLTVSNHSMTAASEGGEQFEYCALAYACATLRAKVGKDPLEEPSSSEFIDEFRRWYRTSRLPALFRSRLARREARIAEGEGMPGAAVAALARATWLDPAWPLRGLGVDADPAAEARAWAESWARRNR
ncbi:MAG: glycosyltransferase family A protein [Elusimicrobia bacterium]|nr:glycosyltransferase family A protein [Elusimicrobiota bacterium]